MLNKTKFYVGITLIVQAFSFLAMFVMLCRKKKSLSRAVLAIALAGGITGICLLALDARDEKKRRKINAARDACCDAEAESNLFSDDELFWDDALFDEENPDLFENEAKA